MPTETFSDALDLKLNRVSLKLKLYAPAHIDSDISVNFAEANIVHVGDTFWNGVYPFIDYSTGGSIDGTIAACDVNLAAATADTIIIAGMVSRSATSPSSRSFATCWSGCGRTSRPQAAGQDPRRNRRSEPNRRL
jgi:glyoxylase-like metal-dependent hydrolase (beta-lactamase superfamily II)